MRQDDFKAHLAPLLPAGAKITKITHLSELWAGYGHIYRIHLALPAGPNGDSTFIVKTIRAPAHKGGYDEGHARKLLSYKVEANFYRDYAAKLMRNERGCFVPELLGASKESDEEQTLILEDLALRFPMLTERRGTLSEQQVERALEWLASFHAASWDIEASSKTSGFCPPPSTAVDSWAGKGLWQQGGYHYLATRMEELDSIDAKRDTYGQLGLHSGSALPHAVDYCLNNPPNRTTLSLIHGDVKAANMAFSSSGDQMAMYDFQYVGIGLGVQDLAKFLTTSISGRLLRDAEGEEKLLRTYHGFLVKALPKGKRYGWEELMRDWELALVSWVRFLAGWAGGFWGNTQWLQGRVEGLLRDKQWVKGVMDRYEARSQT